MATKKITQAAAEKRFNLKALRDDVETHEPIITWTGDVHMDTIYNGTELVDDTDDQRDEFLLSCSNPACADGQFRHWRVNYVNKNGQLPATKINLWNSHILRIRAKRESVTMMQDAALVMEVHMHRGKNHEYWVAHQDDHEFWEATKIESYADGQNRNSSYPWRVPHTNTRGWTRYTGWFRTRDEAIGYVLSMKVKYERKGYVTTIKASTDSGVVPVAATVAISVRKLINDFKELGTADRKNPGTMKKWLDDANDALTTMSLLETLRDEAQENLNEALMI